MKLLIALVTAVLLGMAARSYGRIGETEAQIEARYGAAVKDFSESGGPVEKAYRSRGFIVHVGYLAGRSHKESFEKDEAFGKFSEGELATLLQANSFGATWKPLDLGMAAKGWDLGNGRLSAVYDPTMAAPMLMIYTREYGERLEAAKQSKEKKALSGF